MIIPKDLNAPLQRKEDAKRRALLIAELVQSKHAEEIVIYKVSALSDLADYFIVCTAESKPQMRAILETVDFSFSKKESEPLSVEGRDSGTWLLMDYGDVILHVFNPKSREFYGLDRLWGDAPRITLPDIASDLDTLERGHS